MCSYEKLMIIRSPDHKIMYYIHLSGTLATSCEELTRWKRLWCWEGLGAGGEGDDRGWDVWMASLTRWMWVWVKSGSWWWTGRPGVLPFMGLQRVGHDWVTELKTMRWSFNGGNSAFIWRGRDQSPPHSLPSEDTAGRQSFENQEEGSHQKSNWLTSWSYTSQAPELWEINFCCLSHLI